MKTTIPIHACGLAMAACLMFLATSQIGCTYSVFGFRPDFTLEMTRDHVVEGEPSVGLAAILDKNGEPVGALVQVKSYEQIIQEINQVNNSQQSEPTTPQPRVIKLMTDKGIQLCTDGQVRDLDQQELANGPWIYYLDEIDETEPFRKIHVPPTVAQQFQIDLEQLGPLEFRQKWCQQQPGELLSP